MTLSGAAGKVPVGPLRREGLGYGCQPKSVCYLPGWAAVATVTMSVVASRSQAPQPSSTFANAGCGILSLSFFWIDISFYLYRVGFSDGSLSANPSTACPFSDKSGRIFRRVVTAHSAPLGAANSCNTAGPFRLTVPAPAPANRSVPGRRTIQQPSPSGSAAAVRH